MAGGKRRHARSNPTAGGPRHGSGGSWASASNSSSHAVPFSYAALRPCESVAASEGGVGQVLDVTIDTAPCADPASASVPVYSYGPVGGIGLGFHGEEDAEEEEEEASEAGLHLRLGFRNCGNEEMDVAVEELEEEATVVTPRKPKGKPKGKRNEGFLSVGGIRIYTEDISSPQSGVDDSDEESESDYEGRDGNDDGDSDEEGSYVNEGGSESDELSSGSDSEEDLSIGDSSVDDEVVADYIRGSVGVRSS